MQTNINQNTPINVSPITNLVNLIRTADLSNSKEVRIPIHQAKLIMFSMVEILDKLNKDYDSLYRKLTVDQKNVSYKINIDGGTIE